MGSLTIRCLISLIISIDRMPVPLGDFISRHVYDSRLKSSHTIQDLKCVAFVDVSKTGEEKCGTSWKVGRQHVSDMSSR